MIGWNKNRGLEFLSCHCRIVQQYYVKKGDVLGLSVLHTLLQDSTLESGIGVPPWINKALVIFGKSINIASWISVAPLNY